LARIPIHKKLKLFTRKRNNMQITPSEIDIVEEAGVLDGSPVKMIRTKGGFWIAVGKPKGKMREEAIGAGSHPAIVKYNIEKQYPGFQPSMMKSEHLSDSAVVQKHSHFLSEDLRKSGHDIYSVQVGSDVNFHITRHNLKVVTISGVIHAQSLLVKSSTFPKEFTRSISAATLEKALACGALTVKLEK
jgi:hypothetical protein